jgi:hypothetical protein
MRLPGLSPTRCFADTYAGARAAFLDACAVAGASVESYRHPASGPDGGDLHTDVALAGDPAAARLFVVASGTHGVEGFGGSACQVAFLSDAPDPPEGVALLFVHALNPYGFAHLRRTTEDNVDLNRNFVRHDEPPYNAPYDALHDLLLPADWHGPAHDAASAALGAAVQRDGLRAVQAAITAGQYTHPDGLFYGGTQPVWSNLTWRAVLAKHLAGRTHVAFADLHTGLGAFAAAEVIFRARYDGGGLERARAWYGDVTSSEEGSSVSTVIGGTTHSAVVDAAPGAEVTTVTIEFGTLPGLAVLAALQADNWLTQRGGPAAARAADIKRAIRAAFYPDDDAWRTAVLTSGTEVLRRGVAGLGGLGRNAVPSRGVTTPPSAARVP